MTKAWGLECIRILLALFRLYAGRDCNASLLGGEAAQSGMHTAVWRCVRGRLVGAPLRHPAQLLRQRAPTLRRLNKEERTLKYVFHYTYLLATFLSTHMTMCSLPIFAALLGSALGAVPVPCSNPVTVTVMVKDTWCKASHPHDYQADVGGDGPILWPHISWGGPLCTRTMAPTLRGTTTRPTVGRTVESCGLWCQNLLAATPPGQALGLCVGCLAVSPAV